MVVIRASLFLVMLANGLAVAGAHFAPCSCPADCCDGPTTALQCGCPDKSCACPGDDDAPLAPVPPRTSPPPAIPLDVALLVSARAARDCYDVVSVVDPVPIASAGRDIPLLI